MIDVPRGIAALCTVDGIAVGQREEVGQSVVPVRSLQLGRGVPPACVNTNKRSCRQGCREEGAETVNTAGCDKKMAAGSGHVKKRSAKNVS